MSRQTTAVVVAGLGYVVLWSSGFVGAELGTRHLSALNLLMWRYLIIAPVLIVILLVRRIRTSVATVGRQVVLGALGQVGYLAPVTLAVGHGVPAGTVALIAALQPMVVATVAGPLLGERIRRIAWIGLLVGFAGVTCVVIGDVLSHAAPGWWVLFPLVGMLSLSAATVLGRRWEPPATLLEAITVQSTVAMVGFVIMNLLVGQVVVPSVSAWPAIGWLVILSTLGGYGSYLFVLRQQGATRVSTWLYLSPPVVSVWAWLMFGDRPGLGGVLGLVITAVGVLLVLRGSAPPRDPHAERLPADCAARLTPRRTPGSRVAHVP